MQLFLFHSFPEAVFGFLGFSGASLRFACVQFSWFRSQRGNEFSFLQPNTISFFRLDHLFFEHFAFLIISDHWFRYLVYDLGLFVDRLIMRIVTYGLQYR